MKKKKGSNFLSGPWKFEFFLLSSNQTTIFYCHSKLIQKWEEGGTLEIDLNFLGVRHGSISHPQGQTWGRNLGEKTGSNRTTVAYSIRSALPWTFSLISRLFDERLYRCCRGRSHEEGWSAYGVVHRHPRICRWYQRLTSWTSWLLLVNFDALVICANGCFSLTTLFGSGWRKGEWNG